MKQNARKNRRRKARARRRLVGWRWKRVAYYMRLAAEAIQELNRMFDESERRNPYPKVTYEIQTEPQWQMNMHEDRTLGDYLLLEQWRAVQSDSRWISLITERMEKLRNRLSDMDRAWLDNRNAMVG